MATRKQETKKTESVEHNVKAQPVKVQPVKADSKKAETKAEFKKEPKKEAKKAALELKKEDLTGHEPIHATVVKTPAPAKPRRPRAPKPTPVPQLAIEKTPAVVQAPVAVVAAPVVAAPVVTVPAPIAEPKREGNPEALEFMEKHWATVKDINEQMANQLERVHQQMLTMKEAYQVSLQDLAAQVPSKPSAVVKFTAVASALSIFLSVVSLSFSHSVRLRVMNAKAEPISHVVPRPPVAEQPILASPGPVLLPPRKTEVVRSSASITTPQPTKKEKATRARRAVKHTGQSL